MVFKLMMKIKRHTKIPIHSQKLSIDDEILPADTTFYEQKITSCCRINLKYPDYVFNKVPRVLNEDSEYETDEEKSDHAYYLEDSSDEDNHPEYEKIKGLYPKNKLQRKKLEIKSDKNLVKNLFVCPLCKEKLLSERATKFHLRDFHKTSFEVQENLNLKIESILMT